MNEGKRTEATATQPNARSDRREAIDIKPYTPPTMTCLELDGIEGGQTSRVLEATGGLMTPS